MKRKIIVNHKEYTMEKMSVDTYEEYLDIGEKVGGKTTRDGMELMARFIVKAYGNQFTVEDLKNPETGLDAVGVIMEFQMFEMNMAKDMESRFEKIKENFSVGK